MSENNEFLIRRIENDFKYHAPTEDKVEAHELIRSLGKSFAKDLVIECPTGRELSMALTKLEEAVMWANASIARS